MHVVLCGLSTESCCRFAFQLQELRDIDNEVSWVTNFQYNNFLLRKSLQVPIELMVTCLLVSEQHITLSPGQTLLRNRIQIDSGH